MIMDLLLSLEPQLAFPVVGAVVFAFLVYLFGFQKTQEPDFEKLALLQESKSHKSSSKHRSTPQSQPKKLPKETNGHVVHERGTGGSPIKPKSGDKENRPPTTPKQVQVKKPKKEDRVPDEDLNAGDWIAAPSRKEKKAKKEVKNEPKSKGGQSRSEEVKSSSPKSSKSAPVEAEPEEKVFSVEEILEMSAQAGNIIQLTPTPSPKPAKPVKEAKKVKGQAPPIPIKKGTVEEPKKTVPASKGDKEQASTPPEVKKEESSDAKPQLTEAVKEVKEPKDSKGAQEPKSNVLFDEIGESWEEAKSRGAKKRRARKD